MLSRYQLIFMVKLNFAVVLLFCFSNLTIKSLVCSYTKNSNKQYKILPLRKLFVP